MTFLRFTRPDGSAIEINADQIVSYTAVPSSGGLAGPITTGTRLELGSGQQQDVRETPDQVARIIAGGA